MPKFDSPINIKTLKGRNSNSALLHLGDDNRVGIGIEAPETKLHVDGAITATGLVIPAGILSTSVDTAEFWGFNPKFDEWYFDEFNFPVANGYIQTSGTDKVQKSSDSVLGSYSARWAQSIGAVWEREVEFPEPLYANVFIQGTYSYKFEYYGSGEPGLAITLTHREKANSALSSVAGKTWKTEYSNTFISPTFPLHTTGSWQTAAWRAHTPPNREITKLKIEIIASSALGQTYDSVDAGIELSGGAGNAASIGGDDDYDWYLDGLAFNFMHPDARIDQEGRITGAYIAYASIDDAHIKNMISSPSARVIASSGPNAGLYVDGLVANDDYAAGWSISKDGTIKGTDIKIYGPDGKVKISGSGINPFAEWAGRSLADLDSSASSYLYGLAFEESNATGLMANVGFLATSGTDSDAIVSSAQSLYIANTVDGTASIGSALANGTIQYNGISSNAPPGSIFTGGKNVVKNQDAYILFLANTQKWDSDIGAQQKYHANTLLGEYGLYVLGTPTVGGWVYHPHANDTWYSIDSLQSGNRLHEEDFLVVGKIKTDISGNILSGVLQPPKSPDSITAPEALTSAPAINIPAGGILFADIHLNQWNHTANAGEVQLTNSRNNPNTEFTFIHPGTNDPNDSTLHTVNGAYGVLTSLEDFPGTRYITFVGADRTDEQVAAGTPSSRFTLQTGHSPDFVAAFPIGTPPRWYYNQDEGKFSTFTPTDRDCIVARVDANGSIGALTNIYRYADREATTPEGGVISDIIINPPLGMASGGTLFADLHFNKEFKQSDNTTPANTGFVSLVNTENNPRNRFFVIHPDNGYFWEVANTGRGVVTNLNNGVRTGGSNTGTRHVAFVGGTWPHEENRFPMAAGYENVSNDFIAVTKYHPDTGKIHSTFGVWYYDNGQNASTTFTINANDFIIATLSSFNAQTDGIDQLTRWSSRAAQIEIDGEMVTVDSIRNDLLGGIAHVLNYAETAANTAMDQAILAYDLAANASANATKSLGLLDNKNVIYFTEEGSAAPTSGTYGNAQSDAAWTYNDVWINTSIYGRHLDGSWSTNAIFRYANSAGGFDDSSGTESVPSGEGTVGLAWRHDRTNPTGRSYLVGLEGRDLADRAQINFYVPRSAEVYPFYGPNVAVLSTGELNRNPEGDQWYDIYGTPPENHLYIYRTNTAFSNNSHYKASTEDGYVSATHKGYISTDLGAWAQTVHNTATSGLWNETTKPTGWWDFQDAASGDATAAIESERNARIAADVILDDHAANALSRATDAQAAADREILAFFEIGAPTATSNGDVWIKTDSAIDSTGTKNLNSIFVSNTTSGIPGIGAGSDLFWNYGPNNAIGLMYLQSYSSGVSGEFARGTNIMPRGYSLFDAPLSDYDISLDPTQTNLPYPFFLVSHSSLSGTPKDTVISINTTSGWVGTNSLEVSGNSEVWARFTRQGLWARGSYNYPAVHLPRGKKWILSWYAKSNNALQTRIGPVIGLRDKDSPSANLVSVFHTNGKGRLSANNEWERMWVYFDLTGANATHTDLDITEYDSELYGRGLVEGISSLAPADPSHILVGTGDSTPWSKPYAANLNSMMIRLDAVAVDSSGVKAGSTHNVHAWFDALQLEEVPDNVYSPSQFKEPSDGTAIVFGRKITDGKIVTYYYNSDDNGGLYGPVPNTTPTGLPNPEPHGDFWIDTGNNNIIFRYHQNDFNVIPSSQTIFWTSVTNGDGWYSTEDLRTANALSTSYDALANAASAQAAADREIFAYFQTGPPTASGNGDVWIDTDSFATLNTSSIYVARAEGSGDWVQSPDSAIGQVYLEAWTAGETASRADSLAISAFGTSNLPFPVYPDANGIMGVGATGNVVFYKNSTQEVEPGTSGSGPGEFSAYNRGGVDFVGPTGKLWYPESGGYGIPETGAIHTKLEGLGGTGETTEARYIMYTNQSASVRFSSLTSMGSHDHFVTVEWEPVSESWQVYDNSSGVFKFTPDAANGDFLVGKITRPTPVPEGLKTLESWVFKTLPVQTQNFTDGKIVTHFGTHYDTVGVDTGTWGPIPNTTPTGLANPQPHGDFWINTSNNNIVFRYHQNDIAAAVPSAQTLYHYVATSVSPDGWYSTEDTRTGNALSTSYSAVQDAAAAQAAADHEILVFFDSSEDNFIPVGSYFPPDASGNGDVWIQTDRAVRSDGTANTGAIYKANTQESGAHYIDMGKNRVPPVIARWSGDIDPLNGDYEFTTSPGTATRPHVFYTIVAMHGEAGNPAYPTGTWPAGYANTTGGTMSTELAGATASGAGNTARVEIIESPAYTVTGDSTSNSYFSGRAFHMKSSNVVSGGISHALEYSPGRLEVYFGNTSYSGDAGGGYSAWRSSGTVPLDRGKRWIISYYVKSWKGQGYAVPGETQTPLEFPRFTIHLKKAWNDDGTPNTVLRTSTLRGEADNTWYASDEDPGVVANWTENDDSYVEGTWTRKWRVIDLTSSSNTYYGFGGSYTSTAGEVLADSSLNSIYEVFTGSAPGDFTQTNATIGYYFKSDAPTDGRMSVVATGTVGPTHNVAFGSAISGRDHNVVRLGMFANTWASATDPTYPPAQPAYGTGATFSETNGEARAILRWKTSEDPEWGGADGRQTAREWYKTNTLLDDTLGQLTVYWRNHRIPEWRERNITGISLQFYGDMTIGDQYDLTYVFMGPSSEAKANEIDTMLFNLLQYQSGMEWYIDGLQVEEVAAGVTEPSDLWYPDGAHYWHPSPNNGIGLSYLQSYSQGISGAYQRGDNIMPRAYSVFDAPIGDYDNGTWDDIDGFFRGRAYRINGSTDANLLATHEGISQYPFFLRDAYKAAQGYISSNTENVWTGTKSLAVQGANTLNKEHHYVGGAITYGASTEDDFVIDIPKGKKWIFSVWAKSNATSAASDTVRPILKFGNSSYIGLNSSDETDEASLSIRGNYWHYSQAPGPGIQRFSGVDTWTRFSTVIDLTSSDVFVDTDGEHGPPGTRGIAGGSSIGDWPRNEATKVSWSLHYYSLVNETTNFTGLQHPETVWYDALQLEEVESHVSSPSTFREPSSASAIVFGRQMTDGKIVNHYGPNYGPTNGKYFGPEPEFTPKNRLPNPEPHGDRWVNTSNNRIEFVYNQNGASITTNPEKAYSQTIFWHPAVDATPGLNDPSGWYSTEDERTANALASSYNANAAALAAQGRADDAYSSAGVAQAAADKEILAFFALLSNVPAASGNGDIWVVTDYPVNLDGTPNVASLYISNTLSTSPPGIQDSVTSTQYWNPAPYNAIGLSYLESFASGVSGAYQRGDNIVPRGYSTFDAPASDYDNGTWDVTGFFTGPSYSINGSIDEDLRDTHEGLPQYPFSLRNSSDSAAGYISSNTENVWTGTKSLAVQGQNAGAKQAHYLHFGASHYGRTNDDYIIDIPKGKKWIFSVWAKSNSAIATTHQVELGLHFANSSFTGQLNSRSGSNDYNGPYIIGNLDGVNKKFSGVDTWTRFSAVLDLTSSHVFLDNDGEHGPPGTKGYAGGSLLGDFPRNEATRAVISIGYYSEGSPEGLQHPETVWYDAIQLEEVESQVSSPSTFREPSSATSIVFGRQITDGKILTRYETHYPDDDLGTHWGPDPEFTPKDRLPNPEPHGDSWHNTSNNNLIFRYHQNSINNSAQTMFWTASTDPEAPSGWYSTEDPRTIIGVNANTTAHEALANASTAQAAADREIQVFFYPHYTTVTASGNGDVWIQTDNALKLNGDSNTGSIFVWNDAVPLWQQRPESAIGRGFLKTFTESSSRNLVPSVLSTWAAPLSDYDFTDKYQTSGAQAELTPSDKPVTLYTSLAPRWPLATPGMDMSAELNEATASAGNTARVEIITDSVIGETGNSYVSGRALHLRQGSVTIAGVDTPVTQVRVSTGNGALYDMNNMGAWNSPYVMDIPRGREWVVSWYEKSWGFHSSSWQNNVRGSVAVKKAYNSDGSANTWIAALGGMLYDDRGQYNSPEEKRLNESGGTTTVDHADGEWSRRSTYLDFSGANQVHGYGAGYSTVASDRYAIADGFSTPGQAHGWVSSTCDLVVDSGHIHVTKTGTAGADSVSNTFTGGRVSVETGEIVTSFPGKKYGLVIAEVSANTFASTRAYPSGVPGWESTNIFKASLGAKELIKWTTTEDGTMGGVGGTQTCQRWTGGSGTTTGSSFSYLRWRLNNIPTWRERTITGIEFQFYQSLEVGDKYDINWIRMGQLPEPVANEIDKMGFTWNALVDEAYIDGIQVEDVTGTGRRNPGPFNEPGTQVASDFSRAIADGKIVTHYEINSGLPDYFGPDPSTLPKSGQPNVTPFGDLWVDVANNNIVFRYHQNTTNYTSRKTYHANTAPHNHADESGWYSTEDLRTPDAAAIIGDGSTPGTLVYDTQKALADAAKAATAADAELFVFFETSSNTDMIDDRFGYGSDTGPATGNGDIWIHTDFATNQDGTPNNYAIYFANLSTDAVGSGVVRIGDTGWTQSPYNAIGRGFIEQFASVGVKNWWSSGYSMWDSDASEYNIRDSLSQVFPGDSSIPYPIFVATNDPGTVVNTSFGKVSDSSLQVTGSWRYFANNTPQTNLPGPIYQYNKKIMDLTDTGGVTLKFERGKKWIFSYYAYCNTDFATHVHPAISLLFNDDNDPHSNVVIFHSNGGRDSSGEVNQGPFNAKNEWQRFSYVLNLSNTHIHANASGYTDKWNSWSNYTGGYSSVRTDIDGDVSFNWHEGRLANLNSMILKVEVGGTDKGNNVWFDGFQFEEAPGARELPGTFSDPDRQISDDFARALLDGKILTHYEPAIDNLKAWWMMDAANTSGWIANEVNPGTYDAVWTENSNSNTFVGDTIFGAGKSADLIGTGASKESAIGLLEHDEVKNFSKTTYTLWFKPTGQNGDGSWGRIIDRAVNSNYFGLYYHNVNWSVTAQKGDTLRITLSHDLDPGGGGGGGGGTNGSFKDGSGSDIDSVKFGVWNFYAITIDYDSNEMYGYAYNEIDGFVGSTPVHSLHVDNTSLSAGAIPVVLGTTAATAASSGKISATSIATVTGRYDHVRFYDKVLSKPDIDAIFNIRTRTRKQPDAELYPYWYSNNVVYGPDPELTPQKRLPNPAPHGDYWYDSSDFNRPFRYNQNTVNKVAQTAYYSTIAYQEDKLGYEPSGWFTTGDGTAEISADSIGDVGRDVAESLDRIRQLNPFIDQELKIFFETEGTTHFVNALGTHTTAAYGDIWINTSDYNANGYTGGLVSNAIFRWQNSLGFFTDDTATEASTGATRGMAWRHAEDNAFGQIYLSASYASNAADRLVAVYSMPGTAEASAWYGPNVAFTTTGIRNPNPDGDLWYDTGNNNIAHVFNKVGGTWPEFAQTVHSDASSMVSEGWYRLEDLRTSSFNAAFDLALATGTDRHAQIFYNISSPSTSTGNGDVWIDTSSPLKQDGSANPLSIFVANAGVDVVGGTGSHTSPDGVIRKWFSDSTSALGRSALDGYNADVKSARSELMALITAGASGIETSIPFPVYPQANGIIGVGATGNVKFHTPSIISGGGEVDVINNGGIPFIGPDGIERILTGLIRSDHSVYGGDYGLIYSSYDSFAITTEANTAYLMYTATSPESRFPGSTRWGEIGNIIPVRWSDDIQSWYAQPNQDAAGPKEHPFIPDADQGDFLVGRLRRPAGVEMTAESWIFDTLPAQTRKYSDGKTVYFVSNTFHADINGKIGDTHAYGPNPSTTDNGLTNPEPYGDKWISLSPPYKTYLYFSNTSNKIAQTAFHTPTVYALANYANTNWPYGTSNNSTGWYEYRDTGDALTQEGLLVRLHHDSLYRVPAGGMRWTEDSLTDLINTLIPFDQIDANAENPTPTIDFGDITGFGPYKELFLNSVPPRDANLMGHWTFNSFGVDDNGVRYLPDATGRGNHARVVGYTANQAAFSDHSPGSGFVNISGNLSLNNFSGTIATVPSEEDDGHIVIAQHGDNSDTNLQIDGQPYTALNIADTATFNKGTFCFWVKPGTQIESASGGGHGIFGRHLAGWGSLRLSPGGTYDTANNEAALQWFYPSQWDSHESYWAGLALAVTDSSDADWVHPPINNINRGFKKDEWHFVAWQWDFDSAVSGEKYTRLWIYRDGAGLLYSGLKTANDDMTASYDAVEYMGLGDSYALVLGAQGTEVGSTGGGPLGTEAMRSGNPRAIGNYDEARLYSEVLSARNLRWLFETPSGRPVAAPNRPGIGVRKGHVSFFNSTKNDPTYSGLSNAVAVFHGFDVDGNPADISPYISFNGNVKYLEKGHVKIAINNLAAARKYQGNTGYVVYNDTAAYTDFYSDGATPLTSPDQRYVFAMPIGANSTQPHTWKYQQFWTVDPSTQEEPGWKYFTPDDGKDLVVGEIKLANSTHADVIAVNNDRYLQIESIEAYQMARQPSVVRESYNFNIRPEDFETFQDNHFFSNSLFWTTDKMNGTFIADATIGNAQIQSLAADKIEAGIIEAKVTVGGEASIIIDGVNNRIIIKD